MFEFRVQGLCRLQGSGFCVNSKVPGLCVDSKVQGLCVDSKVQGFV